MSRTVASILACRLVRQVSIYLVYFFASVGKIFRFEHFLTLENVILELVDSFNYFK